MNVRGVTLLLWAACAETSATPDYDLNGVAIRQADNTLVQTRSGQVQGKLSGNTREFLGIPYAQPPLGALRFAAPEPVLPWRDVHDATSFRKSCMQAAGVVSEMDMSEDCLTLNVFAPASEQAAPLPVMVFIHGGAFLAGGSAQYDAKALREAGNVVIVTLNYRLGAFGFLAHEGLCQATSACTNQGLRDQQLALTWVHDNIAAFAGDPTNVTLFGESAGAVSTCAHMFAQGSEGLAQHYILESGSCVHGPLAPQSEQRALQAGQALAHALCPNLTEPIDCLRSAPASSIASVLIDTSDPVVDGYWPWIDHALFEAPLEELLERGRFAQGSVIAGSNQNEWLLWEALGVTPAPLGNFGLLMSINQFFPNDAALVAQHYLPENPLTAGDAFLRLMNDAYFRCPTRALTRGLVDAKRSAYLYEFAVQPAAHGFEVDYVFDMLAIGALFPFQAPSPRLPNVVRAMQGYWTQLAATGNPNRTGLPNWPSYDTTQERMVFQEPLTLTSNLTEADCDFWDSLR